MGIGQGQEERVQKVVAVRTQPSYLKAYVYFAAGMKGPACPGRICLNGA